MFVPNLRPNAPAQCFGYTCINPIAPTRDFADDFSSSFSVNITPRTSAGGIRRVYASRTATSASAQARFTVHVPGAKQVHRKELTVEQESRRLQRQLGRPMHPGRAELGGVHVRMLNQLRANRLAADVERPGHARGNNDRRQTAHGNHDLRPDGALRRNKRPPESEQRGDGGPRSLSGPGGPKRTLSFITGHSSGVPSRAPGSAR